ncbi:hypothetical protein V8Z74_14725 [Comamonas sp. w2-DMI]|uniref:hypothetical protein n=1 Tax=Comamonas sp. w2-DMI TaxID=3126391 RepID=UPI0032E51643
MTDLVSDFDVLTVTVLLPSTEAEREEVFSHIANNGDLHGCMALGAMHGNAINFFRAVHALQDHEEAEHIVRRLSAENALQIRNALAKRVSATTPASETAHPRQSTGQFKVALMMFALGFLACYNFF